MAWRRRRAGPASGERGAWTRQLATSIGISAAGGRSGLSRLRRLRMERRPGRKLWPPPIHTLESITADLVLAARSPDDVYSAHPSLICCTCSVPSRSSQSLLPAETVFRVLREAGQLWRYRTRAPCVRDYEPSARVLGLHDHEAALDVATGASSRRHSSRRPRVAALGVVQHGDSRRAGSRLG